MDLHNFSKTWFIYKIKKYKHKKQTKIKTTFLIKPVYLCVCVFSNYRSWDKKGKFM